MNELKIKKGFTLVELIIVITILVILATIAFVSFQNYTKDARDSNRLMSIKNIQNGLEGFQIRTGIYPEPENSINILAGTSTITKQGYFGESQSDIINIDKLPLDPLDGTKYIYSINARKNKYQLLSYLEANSQLSFINETYADDLINRNIKSFGNKLGIVLNENSEIINQSVDIVNSTGVYKVILDNSSSGTFIGTGETLKKSIFYSIPITFKSCKEIIENYPQTKSLDGTYTISVNNKKTIQVYCDMTTDGGGWTRIFTNINYSPKRIWYDIPNVDRLFFEYTRTGSSTINRISLNEINITVGNFKLGSVKELSKIISLSLTGGPRRGGGTVKGIWKSQRLTGNDSCIKDDQLNTPPVAISWGNCGGSTESNCQIIPGNVMFRNGSNLSLLSTHGNNRCNGTAYTDDNNMKVYVK